MSAPEKRNAGVMLARAPAARWRCAFCTARRRRTGVATVVARALRRYFCAGIASTLRPPCV
eukprot:1261822-Lingulodinium_polyedra.AAC.1